jgi:hypothetical protein
VLEMLGLNCSRVTHKGDSSTEMPHIRNQSVACLMIYVSHDYFYKSNHSERTSLVLHISYCLL